MQGFPIVEIRVKSSRNDVWSTEKEKTSILMEKADVAVLASIGVIRLA